MYAEDSEGTKYDIEIQRSDRGATPKRARYISSMIDADTLLSSEDYDELSGQISRLTAQHQNAASVRFTCSVVLYDKRL